MSFQNIICQFILIFYKRKHKHPFLSFFLYQSKKNRIRVMTRKSRKSGRSKKKNLHPNHVHSTDVALNLLSSHVMCSMQFDQNMFMFSVLSWDFCFFDKMLNFNLPLMTKQ